MSRKRNSAMYIFVCSINDKVVSIAQLGIIDIKTKTHINKSMNYTTKLDMKICIRVLRCFFELQ